MSVGVAVLVVFLVLRVTRLTVQDSLTDGVCLRFVNFWGRVGWLRVQWFFGKLLTCPWCASVWWAAFFSLIGFYWGGSDLFVIAGVAAMAAYITGIASALIDPYRRDWADD